MNSDQFFFAIFGLDSVSSRLKNKDLIQNEIFGGVACNGKSIGEVRGIRRTLVQEFTNEADAFSDCLN